MLYYSVLEKHMIPVDQAYSIILESSKLLPGEDVSLFNAGGRFLLRDIHSTILIPPLDNSAMDGFALMACLTDSATKNTPVKIPISGEVAAGQRMTSPVSQGTAVRIMTGAPMPPGTDTVIPVEDCTVDGEEMVVTSPVKVNENVREAGEDISRDQLVFKQGTFLRSAEVGILASLGLDKVQVYKQPRVAIFSTGDELAEPGDQKDESKIYNSNAYSLFSEVQRSGGIPEYLGIIPDDMEQVTALLEKALEYDIVLTSGGVSMGNYDFIQQGLREQGVKIHFDMVKIKPGKPLTFGTRDDTLFFGLPGNPVSSLVNFMEFVKPAILKRMGSEKLFRPRIKAVLDTPLNKKKGRQHYQRGVFSLHEDGIHVKTTGEQGSGILSSMTEANCLIIIPEEVVDPSRGDLVTIDLLFHDEV